jgi:hypothetical protein
MEIDKIAETIEESCREFAEEENSDMCNDCWNDQIKEREFNIKRINQFIEYELSEADKVLYDAGEAEFYIDEENPGIYEKIDEAYKHAIEAKKLAEIKMVLNARNKGHIRERVKI